ncbi:MAG: permease [Planctomycetota bacterium]|nr:permease [Planctomycetota bacterium]
MKKEIKIFILFLGIFLAAYFVPWDTDRVKQALLESFLMLQDYAREHILLCLVPAFFIAGAIGVFVSSQSVIKYFGPSAKKILSYGVASVSGSILAVCSCTVLPLFAGIYKNGAGIGPATTFLYAGPAINVLAIILTARILGLELGVARAVGAVLFSIVIGLLMHLIFSKEEKKRVASAQSFAIVEEEKVRALWKTALYFAVMVGILVFANWGKPADLVVTLEDGRVLSGTRVEQTSETVTLKVYSKEQEVGQMSIPVAAVKKIEYVPSLYTSIYKVKFFIAAAFFAVLIVLLFLWFSRGEVKEWFGTTWGFAKQIFPLLLAGVLVAGFLLGRPHYEALIPSDWVSSVVGGNSLLSNLIASVIGAFMYFATLTEVPILQGLMGSGMGKGPALALLLSGPALSLPSMLVIRSVLGTKKTIVFVGLVVILSTVVGWLYGTLF